MFCLIIYSSGEHFITGHLTPKKYYVVTAGTEVGIFASYDEVILVTKGISGMYQVSFKSRTQAETFYAVNKKAGRVVLLAP